MRTHGCLWFRLSQACRVRHGARPPPVPRWVRDVASCYQQERPRHINMFACIHLLPAFASSLNRQRRTLRLANCLSRLRLCKTSSPPTHPPQANLEKKKKRQESLLWRFLPPSPLGQDTPLPNLQHPYHLFQDGDVFVSVEASRMSSAHFPQMVGFVVLLLFTFWGDAASVPSDSDARLLSRVIEAVQKGLEFFSEDYSDINVDGLFGLRIGQGQIVAAVEECKASGGCPKDLQPLLEKISDGVEQTSAAAMSYVEQDDPDYFKRFLYVINSPYLLQYRPKKMKNLDSTPAGYDATYDEETGDVCFARIMGTYEENGRKVSKCNFAKSCWDLVSKKDTSHYSITHQLLYFILVEKTGCIEQLEKATGASVQDIKDHFCGAIYNEVLKEVKQGEVNILNQDLFLEQVLLCGILGYEDFVQRDWIEMVLKWQRPNGCFSLPNYLVAMEKKIEDKTTEERKLLKDLQKEVEMISKQHPTGRKLMRETVMSDGCLAHKSGLGFGTLCLYLRYLVRQNYVFL